MKIDLTVVEIWAAIALALGFHALAWWVIGGLVDSLKKAESRLVVLEVEARCLRRRMEWMERKAGEVVLSGTVPPDQWEKASAGAPKPFRVLLEDLAETEKREN